MSQRHIDAVPFRNIGRVKHFMAYLVESFGHPGGDLKGIETEILNLKLKVCCCRVRSSVLAIFRARFRMQLYRAG